MNLINKRIKISFLNMDEQFLRSAEGVATTGSVNIDGASALRRTSQLTFTTQDITAVDYFELYKTKFRLEVDLGFGYQSQGIYLLTSFSSNLTVNNFTFNISGKDKMCLLNGEHGGSFSSSIDAGSIGSEEYVYKPIEIGLYEPGKYYYAIEIEDDEESSIMVLDYRIDYGAYPDPNTTYYERTIQYIQTKLTIKDIITNLLVEYGHEKRENIFIYDLDIVGLELLEYRGSTPLYLYRNALNGKVEDLTIDENTNILLNGVEIKISELGLSYYPLSPLNELELDNVVVVNKPNDNKDYQIIKVEYGQAIGYRDTDLVYAGDLLGNINESIVSILDKIKTMLGNYEYFYNEKGYFIFQKRKDFVNNDFSSIKIDGLGFNYTLSSLESADTQLLSQKDIISIQRTPQVMNIKNDFSIWGNRSGESGQLPIHSRIAIHKQPDWYTNYDGIKFIYDKDNYNSILSEYLNYLKEIDEVRENEKQEVEESFNLILNSDFYIYNNNSTIRNQYLQLLNNLVINPSKYSFENVNDSLKQLYEIYIIIITSNLLLDKIYELFSTGVFYYKNQNNITLSPDEWKPKFYYFRNLFLKDLFEKKDNSIIFTKFIQQENIFNVILDCLSLDSIKTYNDDQDQTMEFNYSEDIQDDEKYLNYLNKRILFDTPQLDENSNTFINSLLEINNLFSDDQNSILYTLPNFLLNTWHGQEAKIIFEQIKQINQDKGRIDTYMDFLNLQLISEYQPDEQGSSIDFYVEKQLFTMPYGECPEDEIEIMDSWFNIEYLSTIKLKNQEYEEIQSQYENDVYSIEYQDKIIKVSDWREIIYQMAKDYYNNHKKIDYWQKINEYNNNRYLSQSTTYEDFYTDLLAFWRQLYYDPLYESLEFELPDGYLPEDYGYYDDEDSSFQSYGGWHRDVYENPAGLNFWFDFIAPAGDLNKFSIENIGVKGKYLNDSKVKSIANKKTPAIKILSSMDWELLGENPDPSYTYIQLEGVLKNAYTISAQGISALEKTQELLFNHTYVQENLNISIIPMEDIDVNSRVKIEGFEGEYTVQKITMPLQYNGAMTLTLTKIPPVLTTEIIRKEFE